jgi:glyoxylase-like metal-dependent hydrolase (beta-lactamase superfamily II)
MSDPQPGVVRPRKQEQEPASAEVTEVGPGVLQLQVPIQFTGLGHVNCYALLDDRGATIVDAGMPGRATWQALRARLRDAGLKVGDVHTVIVTHSHPDHFGSAGRLAHEAGAELITERRFHTWLEPKASWASASGSHGGAPDACADIIEGAIAPENADQDRPVEDDTGFMKGAMRETPWGGSPIPHRNVWFMRLARWHLLPGLRPPIPTRRVVGGDELTLAGREWTVVHTPGHTGDHVCLYDPEERLLISGDHVLPTITPHVPGLSPLADPLGSYLASLEGLKDLGPVDRVLPAHGRPFEDLPGRIDAIVAHHAERLVRLREIGLLIGRGSVVEFSQHLFREAMWGMMAESETYAHLEYMRIRGDAERVNESGRATYLVAPPTAPSGSGLAAAGAAGSTGSGATGPGAVAPSAAGRGAGSGAEPEGLAAD